MTGNRGFLNRHCVFTENGYLSACKCIAVLSIICAHCCYLIPTFGTSNRIATDVMIIFSKLGVSVFFVISGYLFGYNKRSIRDFTGRKMLSLVIPWFFTGSLVYLYVYLRSGGISLSSFFIWISGADSYLWYLTVLMALYYIFLAFRHVRWFPYLAVIISALSYTAAGTGILKLGSPYLNVCNWMWLFAVGILINRYSALETICAAAGKYIWLTAPMYAVMTCLIIRANLDFCYWSLYYIPYTFVSIPFVLGLAAYVQRFRTAQRVGKISFSIYLTHMPAAGLIANFFNRFDLWFTTPLRPFIVLAITVLVIRLYTVCMRKLKAEKIAMILIGGR